MACTQTINGLAKDCSGNLGGLKKVYIAPFDDAKVITLTSGAISTYTAGGGAAKHKAFNFRPGAASFTSTSQIDAVSGVSMVQTQLVMNFGKMDATKRAEIQALLQGEVQVIAVDNNGTAWLLGNDNPVIPVGAQNAQSGAAMTEANQYSITLQDNSQVLPYPFDDASVYSGVVEEVS